MTWLASLLFSPATLWGLSAAIPAVLVEVTYRYIGPGVWVRYLWLWVPAQLLIGYSVYRLVTTPRTSLLDAFIVFAFSTTFMRVAASVFLLKDDVKPGTWVALVLLVLARVAQASMGR